MKKRCISKIVLASSNIKRVGKRKVALIKVRGLFSSQKNRKQTLINLNFRQDGKES